MATANTYDGTGLRQSKTINGVTTNHIWDGTDIVAEANGASITNKYCRGVNGIIYAELNGTETKYLKDGHGNVRGLAEEWDRKARWAGVKHYYDHNNQ